MYIHAYTNYKAHSTAQYQGHNAKDVAHMKQPPYERTYHERRKESMFSVSVKLS